MCDDIVTKISTQKDKNDGVNINKVLTPLTMAITCKAYMHSHSNGGQCLENAAILTQFEVTSP